MSQNKKIVNVFLLSTLLVAPARATDAFFAMEALNHCDQLTHSKWIKRYSEIEDRLILALEKDPKLSQGPEEDFFEVVFPQDLPKTHPMRGAFLGCFAVFNEYQKATHRIQVLSALERLDSCYQDAYKKDPPEVLAKYMDCLKKIKN